MKLTTKNIMFILMSVLLVLTVVMALITLGRVGNLLQLGKKPDADVPQNSTPSSSIVLNGPGSSSQTIIVDPGHEHEFVKTDTFSPSCVSSGYTLYKCSCGKQDIRDFKDPYGHKYGEYSVVAATCTTDGWTERTCSRCNNVEKTNPVPASHSFESWTNVESADGTPTLEQRTCYDCGITEIRSLDTTNTWVLRLTELEEQNGFAHYQVVVDLADSENDPAYNIYSALINPLLFDYVNGELWVYFCTEEIYTPFSVSADNTVVTFYADGNIAYAEPVITPDPGPETPDPENPNPDVGGEDTGGEDSGGDNTGGDGTGSGETTP